MNFWKFSHLFCVSAHGNLFLMWSTNYFLVLSARSVEIVVSSGSAWWRWRVRQNQRAKGINQKVLRGNCFPQDEVNPRIRGTLSSIKQVGEHVRVTGTAVAVEESARCSPSASQTSRSHLSVGGAARRGLWPGAPRPGRPGSGGGGGL